MKEILPQLAELIALFEINIAQYNNAQYDEANTRIDFIDKFLAFLDWDVANNQGFSETYREVVREDKVTIDGVKKAPDYSCRIGGIRKFFVEAKRVSVTIKDSGESAFQVRRYGYTAKLSLSILTNFAEFAVYDTRIKPHKDDKPGVARIFYCTFKEYEKYFSFIYDTFSKNAILKGSFDRYAEEHKNKKGTLEVDEDLLSLIEEWRMELAKNIAKNNSALSVYTLNTAVQRIIDRIVFLRIAEDKGIEDADVLKTITKTAGIYEKLVLLFTRADKKYNSGLFIDLDWINAIKIDDKVLSHIIINLYYPECPYEFSVLPVEILGSIYERFLGKTIRFRGVKGDIHTAIIEEKPEVKKTGGVFYTPQYIVDYIVQNTVGEKIKNKTPEEIGKLKICDPACGSGSFLVGAYQYLLNYHLDYYTNEKNIKDALKKDKIYTAGFKSYILTIAEKQKILVSNIFGLDIDNQAVEVTKLSLYLKLLENEGKEAEERLFKYSDMTLLPSLEENIKCGNSLIGTDFYAQSNLELTDEDRIKINCFDWEKEFPAIFNRKGTERKGKTNREGLREKFGFDAIIGNPPYVRIHEISDREKKYYENNYCSASNQFDLYQLFYEKGLRSLNKEGILGFITSNKFCVTRYGKTLREYMFKNYAVHAIIDVSNLNVFKDASTYPFIFIIKNTSNSNHKVSVFFADTANNNTLETSKPSKIPQSKMLAGNEKILSLNVNSQNFKIVSKIENNARNDMLSVYRGRGTSKDLSQKRIKNSVIAVTNKQINRFILNQEKFYRNKIDYENDFEPKLLMKKICFSIDVAIDEVGSINPINTVYVIKSKDALFDLKFLLAILCSKVITYYARTKYLTTHMRGGYIELRVFEVESLPIPVIDLSNKSDKQKHDNLVSLVEKMLELKQKEAAESNPQVKTLITRQIEGVDKAIDATVYALYGLTDEEITVVKGESV